MMNDLHCIFGIDKGFRMMKIDFMNKKVIDKRKIIKKQYDKNIFNPTIPITKAHLLKNSLINLFYTLKTLDFYF